jgi:hypothetical protein
MCARPPSEETAILTHTPLHRIELAPAYRFDPTRGRATGHETAVMRHAGNIIGESREPLFAAARHLLSTGIARASDLIATFRGPTMCLRARVGTAAKLSVSETAEGLKFVRHVHITATAQSRKAA